MGGSSKEIAILYVFTLLTGPWLFITTGAGCGDDDSASGAPTTSTNASSATGTGGGGTSAGSGGAGGQGGGEGGSGGSGGAGGGSADCLDPSMFMKHFSIEDSAFCAVAIYEADEMFGYSSTPTWGSHGGPLTLRAGMNGTVDLVRWSVPAGNTGALTKKETQVPMVNPVGSFLGSQALDLPFFGWTVLTWSGSFPNTQGEIVLVKNDTTVDKRYEVNGVFAVASLSSAVDEGRLIYTGFSKIEDAASNENALYAADSCGTPAMPSLLPGMDPACKPPILVSAWGDSSGPITTDTDGNAFAIMTTFGGPQEARGFAASLIARGAPAAAGDSMFTLPGFGSALTAIAPAQGEKGLLAFQPSDPITFEALDVVAQRYTTDADKITPDTAPATWLKLAAPGTSLSMMTDPTGRVWVGAPSGMATTFVVLSRTSKP